MDIVLNHSKQIDLDNSKNVLVNINLMSREALANKHLVKSYPTFYDEMEKDIKKYDHSQMKVNVSTIMPTVICGYQLIDNFQEKTVNIYYSL